MVFDPPIFGEYDVCYFFPSTEKSQIPSYVRNLAKGAYRNLEAEAHTKIPRKRPPGGRSENWQEKMLQQELQEDSE